MATTLAELKAENAAADLVADKDENAVIENEDSTSPQVVEDENDIKAAENEPEEKTEDAESTEKEAGENDVEDWMQSDSHESQAEKKYTGSDIGAAKQKLRAKLNVKLDAKDSEIDQLKAKVEALERVPKSEQIVKPKRDDFIDSDDPDEAYTDAYWIWKENQHTANNQAAQAGEVTASKQQKQASDISEAVDRHYEGAVELAEKSGISAEAYHAADLRVRQSVESVFPNAGDSVTDALIAMLGKGSEKVFYSLGVNTAKRDKFEQLLREDKNGIKAAVYLGELKSESAPKKRKTNAPAPANSVSGDASSSDQFKSAKKKYLEAHKSGNMQAAFTIKRAAKKAGANTNDW